MRRAILRVDSGVVSRVQIDAGVEVEIRDYDAPRAGTCDQAHKDENHRLYSREVHSSEFIKVKKPKLWLHLYHGRKTVDEHMDEQGEDGPIIGPFDYFICTYGSTFRLGIDSSHEDYALPFHHKEGLAYLGGVYYGDWELLARLPKAGGTPTKILPPETLPVFGNNEHVPTVRSTPIKDVPAAEEPDSMDVAGMRIRDLETSCAQMKEALNELTPGDLGILGEKGIDLRQFTVSLHVFTTEIEALSTQFQKAGV